MNSLTNSCIRQFLRSSYGDDLWSRVATAAGVRADALLAWTAQADATTAALLVHAARALGKKPGEILEDLGEWLTRQEQLRRLLRFSGSTFDEFVISLQDLAGRINLVLPDLGLSALLVEKTSRNSFRIASAGRQRLAMRVIVGVLRGMADDYGTLALVSHRGSDVDVGVALAGYADAKGFDLVASTY
ncbi:heme NO-binding domain-containing protein [Paracoccus sp. (in: a-proteobacteria)]|uniref:heme NO-binding domain-containing protein n=1 Tax=Paracoccus sp. TaxID=267 RepID=UPI00322047E3